MAASTAAAAASSTAAVAAAGTAAAEPAGTDLPTSEPLVVGPCRLVASSSRRNRKFGFNPRVDRWGGR